MAPAIWSSGDDLEGELAAPRRAASSPCGRPARRARSGRRRRRRRRPRGSSWRRSSRRAPPRRRGPGCDRSTMPATRRSSGAAVAVGTVRTWPTARPSRSARPAGTIVGAAGVERRQRRRRGRPAMKRRRPSAARSAPTTAAASVRVAVEGEVERGDRADPRDPGDRAGQVRLDALVRGDRPDRGHDELARDHVGDPAGGRRAGCWPTPPSATIIASPIVRPPSVSVGRLRSRTTDAPGEALLEAQQERERHARDPGERRQDERDEQRGDEQDGVDGERLDDAGAARRAGQDHDTDERDDHEDDGQPAKTGIARRRRRSSRALSASTGWIRPPGGPARAPRRA